MLVCWQWDLLRRMLGYFSKSWGFSPCAFYTPERRHQKSRLFWPWFFCCQFPPLPCPSDTHFHSVLKFLPWMSLRSSDHRNIRWGGKSLSCSIVSSSFQPHGLQPARLLCPWDFRGKNTRAGCYFFLQGIFPTQGLNPRLLLWQAGSLPLSHLGSKSTF